MRITKYNVMLDENRKNILVAESTGGRTCVTDGDGCKM